MQVFWPKLRPREPPLETLLPPIARQVYWDLANALGLPAPAIGKVEDKSIPGPGGMLPLRVYSPTTQGPWPVLLYVHGGVL